MPVAQPRVLVVARYPAVRAGLRELLEQAGLVVSGEAAPDAAAVLPLLDVDVVVAEVRDGDELGRADVGLPAVMLVESPEHARAGFAASASAGVPAHAWLLHDATAGELAAAVTAVAEGMTVLDPAIARELLTAPAPNDGERTAGAAPLTPREREVLQLLALGLPNKGIAARLGISEHTAKFHVGAVMTKLGAASRTEAVTAAIRRGLLAI